eukprot:3344955-Pyramimonas_sp.AAC.2
MVWHVHLGHATLPTRARLRMVSLSPPALLPSLNEHAVDQTLEEAIGEAGQVAVPTYNRDIAAKRHLIYHMGVGGFHRSHQ